MTLVELLVAMSIMSIVVVVFGSVLASVQRVAVKEDDLGQTNDQIRLALEQIDHELRSGNVMYDPSFENGGGASGVTSCSGCEPNYTMRLYTQTNANTRGQYMCVLWQIDDQQQLLTRMWPPGHTDQATGWRVVATSIVNRDLGIPAFALDPDPLKGDRTLDVTLAANADLTHDPNGTVTAQAAYTGRNTSYGYPTSLCSSTPS
jgi:type II secretory pathway pseudopilin PulG